MSRICCTDLSDIDCSQSPIFPLSPRDRSLSSSGRHLVFFVQAKPGESTKCSWVGRRDGGGEQFMIGLLFCLDSCLLFQSEDCFLMTLILCFFVTFP